MASRRIPTGRARIFRAFGLACLLLIYTFVGVQHRAQDVMVARMPAAIILADIAGDAAGDADGKFSGAAHHCSELCSSLMLPVAVRSAVKEEAKVAVNPQPRRHISSLSPDRDTPPPKLPT